VVVIGAEVEAANFLFPRYCAVVKVEEAGWVVGAAPTLAM
jgi:hypothetical protein